VLVELFHFELLSRGHFNDFYQHLVPPPYKKPLPLLIVSIIFLLHDCDMAEMISCTSSIFIDSHGQIALPLALHSLLGFIHAALALLFVLVLLCGHIPPIPAQQCNLSDYHKRELLIREGVHLYEYYSKQELSSLGLLLLVEVSCVMPLPGDQQQLLLEIFIDILESDDSSDNKSLAKEGSQNILRRYKTSTKLTAVLNLLKSTESLDEHLVPHSLAYILRMMKHRSVSQDLVHEVLDQLLKYASDEHMDVKVRVLAMQGIAIAVDKSLIGGTYFDCVVDLLVQSSSSIFSSMRKVVLEIIDALFAKDPDISMHEELRACIMDLCSDLEDTISLGAIDLISDVAFVDQFSLVDGLLGRLLAISSAINLVGEQRDASLVRLVIRKLVPRTRLLEVISHLISGSASSMPREILWCIIAKAVVPLLEDLKGDLQRNVAERLIGQMTQDALSSLSHRSAYYLFVSMHAILSLDIRFHADALDQLATMALYDTETDNSLPSVIKEGNFAYTDLIAYTSADRLTPGSVTLLRLRCLASLLSKHKYQLTTVHSCNQVDRNILIAAAESLGAADPVIATEDAVNPISHPR
jgi:hypothetical protein